VAEEKQFNDDLFGDSDPSVSDSSEEDGAQNVFNKKQWKRKLKALEKTKKVVEVKNVEKYLVAQQKQRRDELKGKKKRTQNMVKEQRRKERLAKKQADDLRSYKGVFDHSDMTSNRNMNEDYEDNFM